MLYKSVDWPFNSLIYWGASCHLVPMSQNWLQFNFAKWNWSSGSFLSIEEVFYLDIKYDKFEWFLSDFKGSGWWLFMLIHQNSEKAKSKRDIWIKFFPPFIWTTTVQTIILDQREKQVLVTVGCGLVCIFSFIITCVY